MLPSSGRSIVANFFTPAYRIVGKVEVGNVGLLRMLRDPSTAFLQITDASMARLHEPKKLADRFDAIQLVKYGLVLIALSHREDVGVESLARGAKGYDRTNMYPIRAITADFEMEGTLEWLGRFELAALLAGGKGDFYPLYNATMRAIQVPELEVETPALIFNRRKLDVVSLLSKNVD